MTDIILKQILAIRDTGVVNMFDTVGVQRIAFDCGYYELVNYIQQDPKRYFKFILNGKEDD